MHADSEGDIERLRDRARDTEEISDADAEALVDFSDEIFLLGSRYTDLRHVKLLRHCVIMAEEVGGLADALHSRDAAEPIVRWINRTYDNEETNRDYRVALRVFGRRIGDESDDPDDPPESLAWIPSGTSRTYDPAPDPSDMLHWEDDILPMIDETANSRDAALVAVAWDLGARSGETQDLTVGSVTDSKYGLQITLNGKTGRRSPTIIPSVPYLNRWLDDHPARDDPDAPLWSALGEAEPLDHHPLMFGIKRAAEDAGVGKPVTLTNFRKSSAAHLASAGMNQAHIEDHHGWVTGSRVAARYISVFGEASERELARVHGLDVAEDEPDPTAPIECPRCGKETPREKPLCVWCSQALTPEAAADAEDHDDAMFDSVAEGDADETVEDLREIRDILDGNPKLRAELQGE